MNDDIILTGYTKPVIKNCVTCQKEFHPPLEGTYCILPDDKIVYYQDPIPECPLCDESQFGFQLNLDFMPELSCFKN